MTKKNVTNQAMDIAKLVDYKSFLEKALHRVESGESTDAWISSELIMRENLSLLEQIQEAEKISVGELLKKEIARIDKAIIGGQNVIQN